MALEHEQLTGRIIGAAIEVHKEHGSGFVESIYENSLMIELRKRGLRAEQQKEIVITYDGEEVGKHRLDVIVEDTIILELKAAKELEETHFAQARSYLKAFGKRHGLLLNFAKVSLEVKRVIYDKDDPFGDKSRRTRRLGLLGFLVILTSLQSFLFSLLF